QAARAGSQPARVADRMERRRHPHARRVVRRAAARTGMVGETVAQVTRVNRFGGPTIDSMATFGWTVRAPLSYDADTSWQCHRLRCRFSRISCSIAAEN